MNKNKSESTTCRTWNALNSLKVLACVCIIILYNILTQYHLNVSNYIKCRLESTLGHIYTVGNIYIHINDY